MKNPTRVFIILFPIQRIDHVLITFNFLNCTPFKEEGELQIAQASVVVRRRVKVN